MRETINIVNQLCKMINCDADELAEEVNILIATERWLYKKCKEPTRSEAIKWIKMFKAEESIIEDE